MALELQVAPVTPNAIVIQQLILQTGIEAGKLQTRVIATLTGARVEDSGLETETWTPAPGPTASLEISLNEMPEDLLTAGPAIMEAYAKIVEAVGIINSVRKLL